MVGMPSRWGTVQISVTVYPEHAKIIDIILKKEYSKPVAHKSASEVIRKAIEYYADYLGVNFQKNKRYWR